MTRGWAPCSGVFTVWVPLPFLPAGRPPQTPSTDFREWFSVFTPAVTRTALRRVGDTQSAGHRLPVQWQEGQVFESVCSRAVSPAPCLVGQDTSDALMLCVSQNYSDYLSVFPGLDGLKAHEVRATLPTGDLSSSREVLIHLRQPPLLHTGGKSAPTTMCPAHFSQRPWKGNYTHRKRSHQGGKTSRRNSPCTLKIPALES